ncbi:MAG TPA: branched-chain amino acid ABC transporter permease [Rhodobacteraceae bacterium]|nr:branched-chain amino acid ABC transporter permease [Paracoccaceae bacterium]
MPRLVRELIANSPMIAIFAVLFVLPAFISNQYILQVMIFVGIYIVLTLSLNLLNGYVGLLAIGHAAFYAVGAYASAKLSIDMGLPFLLSFILSGIIAGGFGYLLGRPTLGLSGIYLALATLGFNVIVWLILLNWMSFSNGPLGIMDIPPPNLFGYEISTRTDYYYLALVLVILTLLSMHRLVTSRFGRSLVAIREDELAAEASGINTTRIKVQAFILSAFYAGLAGSFYAHFVKYVSPDSFTHMESFTMLAMLALGGQGNLLGPVVGATVLSVVPELFRFLAEYRMFLYGGILVVMMLVRPTGLFGHRLYSFRLTIFDEKEKVYEQGDKFLEDTASQTSATVKSEHQVNGTS